MSGIGFVDSSAAHANRLTPRQVEILVRVAAGRTNAQIGRELFICENTVKKQMKNIFLRLQVVDRASAVAQAYELGVFLPRSARVVQLRSVA
jgi:DNA-binding NarL/FixJ family response regulator